MNILVAIDLSDATETVVNKAEEIAKALSAQMWIVHVTQPKPELLEFDAGPQAERDFLAERYHDEHSQIQEISARLRHEGLKATALLVQGETVETILAEALKLQVDMIVVGSHGRGMMSQLFVGSVSQGILSQSNRPVLVIPNTYLGAVLGVDA
ncbi:universal stress protein [Leptolyngbya sp. BC1307]|uniref:universal stress protein n=1 Tax=Leptolyngbya sp. BC1307 TaxID=2029589 RepID=UPI000EFD9A42|nr:universal stress protein [Leptolyngbya sp. BC1307]